MRRILISLLLTLLGRVACADVVLSMPATTVEASARFDVRLTITNPSAAPLAIELPSPLHLKLDAGTVTATLELTSEEVTDRNASRSIAPGAFMTALFHGQMPEGISGPVTLTSTGLQANALLVQVTPQREATAAAVPVTNANPASEPTPKPPPLALSPYEPIYFIAGSDGGLNAKFQLSFKYRLFDDQGPLAKKLPWLDDIYFSYSQTSLWDLGELSKPFRDSSYRPRLFYANYDLTHAGDGLLRFGFESGFGHESNGKDGTASRSINILYVRPTMTYGDPEGRHFYLAPLIYGYLDKSENPDIQHYRGYTDFLVGFGSKGSWNFWTTLRKGTQRYGSAEANLSYPLSLLSHGDLSGWLLLQFFDGYGENLIDYNRKLQAQWRIGLAVAL